MSDKLGGLSAENKGIVPVYKLTSKLASTSGACKSIACPLYTYKENSCPETVPRNGGSLARLIRQVLSGKVQLCLNRVLLLHMPSV